MVRLGKVNVDGESEMKALFGMWMWLVNCSFCESIKSTNQGLCQHSFSITKDLSLDHQESTMRYDYNDLPPPSAQVATQLDTLVDSRN